MGSSAGPMALSPIDGNVDEVARHLLCARSKIEAVGLEFEQIMGELAAYSARLPPMSAKKAAASVPVASPPCAPSSKLQGDVFGRHAQAEHYFVGTPLAPPQEDRSFSGVSAAGRQLVESLGE